MTPFDFYKHLKDFFPFETTPKQDTALQKIARFVCDEQQDQLFVLKGYAGTGKTTLISTLVQHLKVVQKKYVMLAPTGRAAKVISSYSGQTAHTIHKRIYYPKRDKSSGMAFTMQANKFKNTVFIVDESSMISDTSSDQQLYRHGSLLDDLIYYVYSGQHCKLILVGDTAQLPPVHSDISPALDENRLELNYQLTTFTVELDEVMRQEQGSGILYNATELRFLIQAQFFEALRIHTKPFNDIVKLDNGYDILDAIEDAYSRSGTEETVFIVRSNKRANLYNQHIRARILDRESELSTGDYLMVVKNNYFWLKDQTITDFIANGDIMEVLQIYKFIELYGFRFAEIKVRMTDYPQLPPFDTMVLLDTLQTEVPALTYEDSQRLYHEIALDYQEASPAYRKLQKIKENPYYNALQVKFAYAVTCHKSQGGQWETVFVEQPYLPDGLSKDYLRWLYTAMTRAKEKLYLINFEEKYFLD